MVYIGLPPFPTRPFSERQTTTVTVRLLEAAASEASLVAAFGTSSITPRCISSVAVLDGATEKHQKPSAISVLRVVC